MPAETAGLPDYVDVQISIDGATADVNDAVRGPGSFAMARRAMDNLAEADFEPAFVTVNLIAMRAAT